VFGMGRSQYGWIDVARLLYFTAVFLVLMIFVIFDQVFSEADPSAPSLLLTPPWLK